MKRGKTPTFIMEVPLALGLGQPMRQAHHLEATRALYNALLNEAMKRLSHMWCDPSWQQTRTLPRLQKQAPANATRALREQYAFSEYALHAAAKALRMCWIAYQVANKVCPGQARSVCFRNRCSLSVTRD